jgi:hypothetical protein
MCGERRDQRGYHDHRNHQFASCESRRGAQMELHVLVISIPVAAAKVANHRNARLRRRLEMGDLARRANEPVHVTRVPLELALRVTRGRPDSTQLGEERVTGSRSGAAIQAAPHFRGMPRKQLDNSDGELPVDEILSSPSGSNAPNVREVGGFSKRLLGKEGRATARLSEAASELISQCIGLERSSLNTAH